MCDFHGWSLFVYYGLYSFIYKALDSVAALGGAVKWLNDVRIWRLVMFNLYLGVEIWRGGVKVCSGSKG